MTDRRRAPPAVPNSLDSPGDEGWTLLELLVGLVLLSLIAVLLVNSLRAGRGALAAIDRQSREATVEAAQSYLRRAAAQARPVRLPGTEPDTPLVLAQSTSLHFVTDYVPAGQYGGLYSVAFQLASAARPGAWNLVETRTLHRPPSQPGVPEPARPQTRSVLLRDIANVAFSFYGAREEQRPADWGSDWPDPNRLPRLIAIDVEFPAGDRRRWSRLVIGLPAGQN